MAEPALPPAADALAAFDQHDLPSSDACSKENQSLT